MSKHAEGKVVAVCTLCLGDIVEHWNPDVQAYTTDMVVDNEPMHAQCTEHGRLWKRINALEELIERMKDTASYSTDGADVADNA